MQYVAQRPKVEIVAAYRDHVSSGKVDFFAACGMDFVSGRRAGLHLCDVSGRLESAAARRGLSHLDPANL